MFTLAAPYPLIQTTSIIPSPLFGDSENATGTLNTVRMVRGPSKRVYVKNRNGRRKFKWDFRLTRNKAIELLEFYRSYNGESVFVEDHNGRKWVGYITNNPFEIEMNKRGLPTRQGWPLGELCNASIEFEGFQTNFVLDPTDNKIFSSTAKSTVGVEHNVFVNTPLPTFGVLQNNWDAYQINQANRTVLSSWIDVGPAGNNLIGRIGGLFHPTINRSPFYNASSVIFGKRPVVSFGTINNGVVSDTASMLTTSNMSLFPNRRGTIFWVMSTVSGSIYSAYDQAIKTPGSITDAENALESELEVAPICDATLNAIESGVWSLQSSSGGSNVEQVHFSGANSSLTPVNARFQPSGSLTEFRLATDNNGPVCALDPNIFMVSRDSDTNLRFRTNGVERSGVTINNNPGYTGKFYVNDQTWIPEFDSKVQAEWAQILVFTRELNTTEIQQVETYLSLRWGIPLGEVDF